MILTGCSSSKSKYNAEPSLDNKYDNTVEPCDGLKLHFVILIYGEDYYRQYNIDEYKIEKNIKGQSILTLYGPCGMIVFFPMDNVEYLKFREM